MRGRIGVALAIALAGRDASAAPPPGQSAYLSGMHDPESSTWIEGATGGCDRGWITDLQYIGFGGTPGADNGGFAFGRLRKVPITTVKLTLEDKTLQLSR